MTEQKRGAVCVGEVLIELARGSDGRFSLSCGGDTFNTAVYLARAGIEVAFASVLGDDPYSDSIMDLAVAEGVSGKLILRVPGRLPGLALIENGPAGERSFRYWREGAPARDLFELPDWMRVADGLMSARLIYFSGITLSLYSNAGIGRFLALLEAARSQGAKVAFDGNFRPRGWKGDLTRTRTVFIEALKRVDIALPTFDDEAVLWGDPSPEATVARLQAFGIGEIVVKNGPNSALVASAGAGSCRPTRPGAVRTVLDDDLADAEKRRPVVAPPARICFVGAAGVDDNRLVGRSLAGGDRCAPASLRHRRDRRQERS